MKKASNIERKDVLRIIAKAAAYVGVFMILILFVFCVVIDLDHKDIGGFYSSAIGCFCGWCSNHGFYYAYAGELIKTNYAVAIAVIGLVVAVFPIIVREKEEKVFGIHKSELSGAEWFSTWMNHLPIIMILFPLLMFVTLILEFYVTGIWLFFITLVGMAAVYIYYLYDHNGDRARLRLVNKFETYMINDQDYNSSEAVEYRMLVDDVGNFAASENNWRDATKVMEQILDISSDNKQHIFALVHFFTDSVYRRMCITHSDGLFNAVYGYKETMMKQKAIQKFSYEDSILRLWAILSAAIYWATPENVDIFIESYGNYIDRTREQYARIGNELSWDEIYLENGVLILFVECWLSVHGDMSDNSYLCNHLGLLWEVGRTAFRKDKMNEFIKEKCVSCYTAIYGDNNTLVSDAYKKISDDVLNGTEKSTILIYLDLRGNKNQ